VLGVPRGCHQHLIGDFGIELGLAAPDDLKGAAGRMNVRRIATIELLGPMGLGWIRVGDEELVLREIVPLDEVNRTPVSQSRHRQMSQAAQGEVGIERLGE
jgi:hypothetical protein